MNTLSRRAGYRRCIAAAATVALVAASAASAAAHHGNHKLSGSGTMTISDEMTCGADNCYTVGADFPPSSSKDVSATVTGQGMTDPSMCQNHSGASCCAAVMTLSFTFDQSGSPIAGINCAFAGKECDKPASSPTTASFKGKIECSDGTGELTGATGSGKLSGDVSTSTGEGRAFASIRLK